MGVAQVHAAPKKSRHGAAVAGRSPGQRGFTDSNAKWLKPKAAVRKSGSANIPLKKPTGSARQDLGSSPSGTDSEDKPLPGELSDGGESLLLSADSDGDLDAAGMIGGLSGSSSDQDDGSGVPAGASGPSAPSSSYTQAQHPG